LTWCCKALDAIRNRPNHKRPGKIDSEERHDFVLHAMGDRKHEIHPCVPAVPDREQDGLKRRPAGVLPLDGHEHAVQAAP
jgi:hypothetical protein